MKAQKQHDQGVSMDIVAMLTGAGISASVGIVGKVLGFWKDSGITEKELKDRLDQMKAEMDRTADSLGRKTSDFNSDLKQTIAELRAVVITQASLQSSQDVLNKITEKMLDSLARKAENHDRIISETQGMIGQVLKELKRNGS